MKNRKDRESLVEFDACLQEMLAEQREEIEIPEELNFIVESAISEGMRTSNRKNYWSMNKNVAKFAVAFSAAIICMLNFSPAFAKAAQQIPAAGTLFRFFTFREYRFEDEIKYVDINIPKFVNTGKADLEKRVNQEIQHFVNQEIKSSEQNAKDYYESFIETGGKKEEFEPLGITIDYKVNYMSNEVVSFTISKYETRFSAYNDDAFYNIDMETGNCMTIRDYLGKDYKKLIADTVKSQIEALPEETKALFWEDLVIENLISESMPYYIDENKNAVVVFEKYEIAVGAAGKLEFTIPVEEN